MADKITFFRSYYEAVKKLDSDEFKDVLMTLFEYAFEGKEPENLSSTAEMFWTLVKPTAEISLKRSKAGRKGGRQTQAKLKQTASKPQANVKQNQANGDVSISHEDIQSVIDRWNELPEPVPKVKKLVESSPRMKQLKARIREYGIDDVLEAIDNVSRSPFLLGQRTDFIINFTWFIGPKNFAKVLDGNYLDRQTKPAGSDDYLMRRIAEEEAKENQ